MTGERLELDELVALVATIDAARIRIGRPIVVGISGSGGSGKSTLARALAFAVPGAVRLRGDDFLDPERSHRRSAEWEGVERVRLVDEVLRPFQRGEHGMFRRYDWGMRRLGSPEPVPRGEVLLVDAIGLFHPETVDALDLRIWCDVDLETATERGMARDEALGRRHRELWREVWVPNERDFAARFDPRGAADLRFRGGAVLGESA